MLEDHADRAPRVRAARPPARAVRSAPSTVTVPAVGRSSRLTQRMRVDLPAPLWPMTPYTSPALDVRGRRRPGR